MSGPDRDSRPVGSDQPQSQAHPPPASGAQIDPRDSRWADVKNWANLRLGRFDAATRDEYIKHFDDYREESDCKKCEKNRDFLLQYSPIVRFMQEKISHLGGDLHTGNIVCQKCPELMNSGFDPDYGILLCANRVRTRKRLEDAMTHEMVHAYDHLRFKLDWDNNLKHAACTEIRASSLSGECRFANEFFRNGIWKLANQHQECVRRRATLSVRGRPFCKSDYEAAKAVNDVWESCFADTRPFDEIYK